MTPLTCRVTQEQLEVFHDQELPLADQIAVEKHLDTCRACAAELDDLRVMRAAFSVVRSRVALSALTNDEGVGFQTGVLSRMKAERNASFSASLRDMFQDMRLVYAGLGASVAATACLFMMLNMFRVVSAQQPDSLAGILRGAELATHPAVPAGPVVTDARLLASTSVGPIVAADSDLLGDAEYVVRAVVTRDGHVTDVQVVYAKTGQPVAPEIAVVLRPLVGAVSKARFAPASVDGLPMAVNMTWQIPQTTVRGGDAPATSHVSAAGKKRVTLRNSVGVPVRV